MAAPWWLPEEDTELDPWFTDNGLAAWDRITIGQVEVPGIIDIKGTGGLNLDVKTPKGRSAVRYEFSGYSPFQLQITVLLYRQQDWVAYSEKLLPLIRPVNPGKSPQRLPSSIDIAHPALRDYKIQSVVIKRISLPESKGEDAKGRQIKTITIECGEDFPVEWKKDATQTGGALLTSKKPLPGLEPVVPNFKDNRPPSKTATLDRGLERGGKALIASTKKKAADKNMTMEPDPFVAVEPAP